MLNAEMSWAYYRDQFLAIQNSAPCNSLVPANWSPLCSSAVFSARKIASETPGQKWIMNGSTSSPQVANKKVEDEVDSWSRNWGRRWSWNYLMNPGVFWAISRHLRDERRNTGERNLAKEQFSKGQNLMLINLPDPRIQMRHDLIRNRVARFR